MPASRLTVCVLGLLVMSACQSATTAPSNDAPPAVRAGVTGPPDHPRDAHLREAMRGLRYDSGLVEIDDAVAAEIVGKPDPRQAQAEYERGEALLRGNRRVGAIQAFTRAALHDPRRPDAYDGLGRALMMKGKSSEAVAALRTALQLAPERTDTHFRLGLARQVAGDLDAAIATWRELLDREPDHTDAHRRLAIALYYVDAFDAAWTHVRRAEELGAAVPPQFRELLAAQMPEPLE